MTNPAPAFWRQSGVALLVIASCLAATSAAASGAEDLSGDDLNGLPASAVLKKARGLPEPKDVEPRPLPREGSRRPSIFDGTYPFAPSPLPDVGASGLFPPHPSGECEIALLTNGEASLAARLKILRSAAKSIRIQALVFFGDETGLYVANRLKQLKRERPELNIRVIVDALSNIVDDKQRANPLRWPQTQNMYYDLEQNGIPVEGYAPFSGEAVNEFDPRDPTLANKRFHDKLWIVDGETAQGVAIMGGMNIANEYFRVEEAAEHRWRDQDIMVRGPVVRDLAAAFDRNFSYQESVKAARGFITDKTQRLLEKGADALDRALPRSPWTERSPNGGPATIKLKYLQDGSVVERIRAIEKAGAAPEFSPARVRFIQSRPRLKETYILQAYLELIRSARREILVANAYFIPKGELLRELRAAARRGVAITILTNSDETNDLPQLTYVSRYFYQYLLSGDPESRGRIRIYEWRGQSPAGSPEEGTMHAKFMIVDRKSMIVGSYNLDPRSERLNSETVMALESEELSRGLARQFLEDDLLKASPISAAEAAAFHRPKDIRRQFQLGFSMSLDSWIGF